MDHFREIWLVDFEFCAPPGERPEPICMVAREYRTGRPWRLWRDELFNLPQPPFSIEPDSLFVAYYASAEIGCFLALGWPMPARILDLFAEFRCVTNGQRLTCGNKLLGALSYFGLDSISAVEKSEMRDLAMRGGPFTDDERSALLNYCETDVESLGRLLKAMAQQIDLPRTLLRGRSMAAAAHIEWTGVPVDLEVLNKLLIHWDPIKSHLIAAVDQDFGVYVPAGNRALKAGALHDGTAEPALSFSAARFADWLCINNIPWPRLESGALDLADDAFRQAAGRYPAVAPLRELRHTLSQLRLNDLAVGKDGRNRCLLSAFRARTGRNQPSNSQFIFGPSVWLRGLIRPTPGRAIAYIDYEQQEFGIAAALSDDEAMMAAYTSGDPYLMFAKQARAVPQDATKATHERERNQFKICALGVQYGMSPRGLAQMLGEPEIVARRLLELHRQTFPRYWAWSEAAVDHARLRGWLRTVFGWQIQVGPDANSRSLANFAMQANGAEMLRLACCLATERGINVCAPIHDAILIESAIDDIEEVVAKSQAAMREASEIVLSGFRLRTDVKIVRYPERYHDSRGVGMWTKVMKILEMLEADKFTTSEIDCAGNVV